ncbi:MAG: hypothetical protein AB1730_00500 [Myxococcota bacterium]|jgi:hypothetical protein
MKKLILAAGAFLALSGCVNAKFVTARTWVGGDTLYVAYTDYNKTVFSSTYDARVLRCNRQPSNALQCVDEQQLTALLNEGSSTASGK